jgi:hypothetical protein
MLQGTMKNLIKSNPRRIKDDVSMAIFNIARGLKFYHFLMIFTAKSKRELSAKSI